MKWRIVAASGVVAVAALVSGLFGYRSVTCSSWQDDYKRFIYTDILKNAPVIYGPEEIDAVIGERPDGCERPTELSDEDLRRFRDEGVGPNYFRERMRASTS